MAGANVIGGIFGGALIGLAAVLLLLFNGRIAGVSGIFGGIMTSDRSGERIWRIAFVLGLVLGAAGYAVIYGSIPLEFVTNTPTLIFAGLLVGFGTSLGSGCTSGHGVCGLARRSPRSLLATVTFLFFGILTVYLARHVF